MDANAKKEQRKEAYMCPKMNLNDFPQEVVLLEDRYPATLKEVTEYEKDYGDGPVCKLAWVFEVEADDSAIDPDIDFDEELTGVYEIAAHTSLATGPRSNFATLNFPAFVGEDWSGDTDEVIGKKCLVDVTAYETKGGQTRNVIEKIRQPQKGKTKAGAKTGAIKGIVVEEASNADFDEIQL